MGDAEQDVVAQQLLAEVGKSIKEALKQTYQKGLLDGQHSMRVKAAWLVSGSNPFVGLDRDKEPKVTARKILSLPILDELDHD